MHQVGNAGRPRLRLGNRGGKAPRPPQKDFVREKDISKVLARPASAQALGFRRPASALPSGSAAKACWERARSHSNASASTWDTDRWGENVTVDPCTQQSLGSGAAEQESVEGEVEPPDLAQITPVAAATHTPLSLGQVPSAPSTIWAKASQADCLDAAATSATETIAGQEVPIEELPFKEPVRALWPGPAAGGTIVDDGPGRPRPRSRPPSAPATRALTRPSSAHAAGHPLARLPLTSIAFAVQALQPRGSNLTSEAGPPSRPQSGNPNARHAVHMQALKDAAGHTQRSSSAGNLHRSSSSSSHGLVGGKFSMQRYLGKGTSAQVWEALDGAKNERVAIKVFDKSKGNWPSRSKQAVREAKLLQTLSHPAIVKVYDTFDAPMKFHIIMELVAGGSLRELLMKQPSPGLGEATSHDLFEQICGGVRFCHGRNIVHRDLKLENIICEAATGNAKIIDFGFALQLRSSDQRLRVFCGTPSYMAPELIMGKEYSGFCADMWALGVVLYGMLVGRLPFEGQTESQLFAKIRRGSFRFPEGFGDLPQHLISNILRIDAPSRLTAAQAYQHRWVNLNFNGSSDWHKPPMHRPRPSSVPPGMRRSHTTPAL